MEDDHFAYNFYEENDPEEAPPGTECKCSVVLEEAGEGESYTVDLRGEVAVDESEVPAGFYVVAPFGGIDGWSSGS